MKFITKCLYVSLFGLSSVTFAADSKFTLVNNTNQDLTAKLNGVCSTQLLGKENGITPKGRTKTIDLVLVQIQCRGNTRNCLVEAYANSDCSGNKIASAKLGVEIFSSEGVIGVIPGTPMVHDSKYQIEASNFFLKLSGG